MAAPTNQHLPANRAEPAKAFDPWILWVTFRRCWLWALPVGTVLASGVAFLVLQTFEPRYRASYLLEANEDFVVFKGVMPSLTDLAKSEKALFNNPMILDPVLNDPELRKTPGLSDPDLAETNLRKNLSLTSGGSSARLWVNYEDTDPNAAADVCNAVVASYLRQRDAFDNTRVSKLQDWLSPEVADWEDEVKDRQKAVQRLSENVLNFAAGQPLKEMEEQSNMALVSGLRAKIADLEVQLKVMDAMEKDETSEFVAQEFQTPEIVVQRVEPTETQITAAIMNDPAVVKAGSMVQMYDQRSISMELGDTVRTNRDYYEELKRKRSAAEADLNSAKGQARERVLQAFKQATDEDYERRKAEAEFEIKVLRTKHIAEQNEAQQLMKRARAEKLATENKLRDKLQTELKVLQSKYDIELEKLQRFGGMTAELQFAQEELSLATEVLTKLKSRVAAIHTERSKDGAVRTLFAAVPPTKPVEAMPLKQLLAASGAVFLVPFLIGFLWEFKVQRLTDSSALEKSSKLAPVVGEIAKLSAGGPAGKGRRVFEESIDTLRANLFLSIKTKHTRSLAVVSSMSGEGKSSVASQLALSIAKATGETVLLVDTDLRCPDQHDIFGLEMGPGLTSVLAGEATLSEAADSTLGDLVHVLPAGTLKQSPHRLVSTAAMQSFVTNALQTYQFVVFDTPPVLAAGETLAVASVVDSTLLCVMRDVSRMDHVKRTTLRLEAAGANIAGTVFSGVPARQYAYKYGDYHYALHGDINV